MQQALYDILGSVPPQILREEKDALAMQSFAKDHRDRVHARLDTLEQRSDLARGLAETHLASLFAASYEGPVTQPMTPYNVADHDYQLAQEDAAEFVLRFLLDSRCSPSLAPIYSGIMLRRDRCSNCGHVHAPVEVEHQSLELDIEIDHGDGDETAYLEDVHSALATYLVRDSVQLNAPCEGCGLSHQIYTRLLEPYRLRRF